VIVDVSTLSVDGGGCNGGDNGNGDGSYSDFTFSQILMIIHYVKVTEVTKKLLKLKEPINNIDNDSKNI
jgi:hypothetical protein